MSGNSTDKHIQMYILLEQAEVNAYVGVGEEKNHQQKLLITLSMEVCYLAQNTTMEAHHQEVVCYDKVLSTIKKQCEAKHTFLETLAAASMEDLFADERVLGMTLSILKKNPPNMNARAGVMIKASRYKK